MYTFDFWTVQNCVLFLSVLLKIFSLEIQMNTLKTEGRLPLRLRDLTILYYLSLQGNIAAFSQLAIERAQIPNWI